MMGGKIVFQFKANAGWDEVIGTLQLAIIAAEALHGEEAVYIWSKLQRDDNLRLITVDANNEIGQTIATIFSGLSRREFGADCISISVQDGKASK